MIIRFEYPDCLMAYAMRHFLDRNGGVVKSHLCVDLTQSNPIYVATDGRILGVYASTDSVYLPMSRVLIPVGMLEATKGKRFTVDVNEITITLTLSDKKAITMDHPGMEYCGWRALLNAKSYQGDINIAPVYSTKIGLVGKELKAKAVEIHPVEIVSRDTVGCVFRYEDHSGFYGMVAGVTFRRPLGIIPDSHLKAPPRQPEPTKWTYTRSGE